jgi:bifunctional DNA-binding transcriptional regulator/antitoxin component of YhaV-PrlF toxin-antitoxin module
MPTLEVIQVDNELGVILPKEVLERLGVVEGDELLIAEEPDGLYISSRNASAKQPFFLAAISSAVS